MKKISYKLYKTYFWRTPPQIQAQYTQTLFKFAESVEQKLRLTENEFVHWDCYFAKSFDIGSRYRLMINMTLYKVEPNSIPTIVQKIGEGWQTVCAPNSVDLFSGCEVVIQDECTYITVSTLEKSTFKAVDIEEAAQHLVSLVSQISNE